MPILLLVITPLVGAILMVALGRWPSLRNKVLVAVGVVNLMLLTSIALTHGSYVAPQTLFNTLPGLNIAFHLEPLGLFFAFTASVLWPITSVYAIGYLNATNDQHQTRFHALFCVAIASAMGIACAENLFTLFLFYEILTFSTWPLVTHSRSKEAISAGRKYLGILLCTSVLFLLLAIVLVGNYGETLSFKSGGVLKQAPTPLVAILLVLFLFGIGKAALMPFHRWLPNAMVAPAPVSALLHAVAVVKAGVFSILKISIYIFGMDTLQSIPLAELLIWVPALTILLASAIAMKQDDIKARLAYSTVSQLSYIVLAALLATDYSWIGGALHIPMHAFGKITLFFCAGAFMVFAGKKKVSEMDGLGRAMPWTFGAFFIASISIAGLPVTGGLWSKWYIALGTLQADKILLLGVLMLSSLLNLYYLTAIPIRAFFLKPKGTVVCLENRMSLILPLVITASVSVVLFFCANPLVKLIKEFWV